MPLKRLILSLGLILLSISSVDSVKVQAQPQICSSDGNYESPSPTYRTIKLRDFGLEVDIPSNYRTMKRQDGSVEILHPDDFEMIQCIARGGSGGGGYYSQSIELIDRDKSMSLREQAIWAVGYSMDEKGNRAPVAKEVLDYQEGDLSGYIVTSQSEYSAIFMGTIPGQEKVLQMAASCDCPVEIEDVTQLLARTRLMK